MRFTARPRKSSGAAPGTHRGQRDQIMMQVLLKTALALVFVAILPLPLRASPQGSSSEPLRAKEVRKAEKEAKTAADHVWLAAHYQSKAQHMQSKLAEAEDQVDCWGR